MSDEQQITQQQIIREVKVTYGIHGQTFVNESPFVVIVNGAIFSEQAARELQNQLTSIMSKIDEDYKKINSQPKRTPAESLKWLLGNTDGSDDDK